MMASHLMRRGEAPPVRGFQCSMASSDRLQPTLGVLKQLEGCKTLCFYFKLQ